MNPLKLSSRIQRLTPSPTHGLDARVKELQRQGIDIVNLSIGEPYQTTPTKIRDAGIAAIQQGFTHYTPIAGILELREAIAQKLWKENHVKYEVSEIVVGVGTKQLLATAFQVLCNPGVEVLVPTPTWPTYIEQIKLADAVPVCVALDPPFRLTLEDLQHAKTSRTVGMLLNSPSNPTGAVIDPQELERIAQWACDQNLFIVTDEIYEKLLYRSEHCAIASCSPEVRERTITINGVSKSHAMTGWRVGYAAGPAHIMRGFSDFSSQITSGTSGISQKAALAAMTSDDSFVASLRNELQTARDYVCSELSKVPGLRVVEPDGAMFVMLGVQELFTSAIHTSLEWAEQLLSNARVAVVPCEAFHAPGFVRMSLGVPFPILQEGIRRIQQFIQHE